MRKGYNPIPGTVDPESIQALVERVVDRINGPFTSSWVEDILIAAGREQRKHTVTKCLARMKDKRKVRIVGRTRKSSPGRRIQSPRWRHVYAKLNQPNQ